MDRLPPHSPEAEQGVLGCVLLSPNDCMGECVQRINSAEVFYDLRHQVIYETLVEMYDQRVPIDVITLQERLKLKQRLEEVGGLVYLSTLPDTVPSAANMGYYLQIVLEKFVLRKIIHTATEITARIYEHEGEVDGLLDEYERDVMQIRGGIQRNNAYMSMKTLVKEALCVIEDFHQRQGRLVGIGTGIPDLDKMTGGMSGGEMIVIAARPSVGKTSLAMQIAEHVAVEEKLPVGVFSLEMSEKSLALRTLCSRAKVNFRNLRDGIIQERDFQNIIRASGALHTAPIFIDGESGTSIMKLRAKARRMVQREKIKLLVIDYLQLLNASNTRGRRPENRQQEITEISNGIKDIAKELNIPVIVLSQLNRDMEKQKRKPMLADLRESGSIEQDADIVGLLWKKEVEDDGQERNEDIVPTGLSIAKQRNGPTGEINLIFLKPYTRFESVARVSDEDIPHE